jgi:hypothetical protein
MLLTSFGQWQQVFMSTVLSIDRLGGTSVRVSVKTKPISNASRSASCVSPINPCEQLKTYRHDRGSENMYLLTIILNQFIRNRTFPHMYVSMVSMYIIVDTFHYDPD